MHHNFSSRLNRSAAELLILTIIQSKGKTHPYEIQQTLHSEIFHSQFAEIQKSSHLIEFSKNLIKFMENPSMENEILFKFQLKELLPDKMVEIDEFLHFKNTIQNNEENLVAKLRKLLIDAQGFVSQQQEKLKIWNSKTAIYQVMEDLEKKQKLISVVANEVIKGRSRKIYSITEKGKETAIKWILELGDLYDRISPKITQFTGIESVFIKTHRFQVLNFMEQFFPKGKIAEILVDDSNSPFSQLFRGLFPIIGNPSKLKTLLLSDNFQFDLLNENLIPKEYKDVYKKILLKQMKKFKNQVDSNIKSLEKS